FTNRNRGSMTVQMATVKMDGIVQCLPVRREELNAFRGHNPFGFGKCNLRTESRDLIVPIGCSLLSCLLCLEVKKFPTTLRATLAFPPILTVWGREFEDFEGLPRSSSHSKLVRLFTPGIK